MIFLFALYSDPTKLLGDNGDLIKDENEHDYYFTSSFVRLSQNAEVALPRSWINSINKNVDVRLAFGRRTVLLFELKNQNIGSRVNRKDRREDDEQSGNMHSFYLSVG